MTRAIDADFPCPLRGSAKERWGSGTRSIVVTFPDGDVSISERWPGEVTP